MNELQRYYEIVERSKQIIEEIRQIRQKYYPLAEIDPFSDQDAYVIRKLKQELANLCQERYKVLSKIPQEERPKSENIEILRNDMLRETEGIPKIRNIENEDSKIVIDKMHKTLEIAKQTVERRKEAILKRDREEFALCNKILKGCFINFSCHSWGKGYEQQIREETARSEKNLTEKQKAFVENPNKKEEKIERIIEITKELRKIDSTGEKEVGERENLVAELKEITYYAKVEAFMKEPYYMLITPLKEEFMEEGILGKKQIVGYKTKKELKQEEQTYLSVLEERGENVFTKEEIEKAKVDLKDIYTFFMKQAKEIEY